MLIRGSLPIVEGELLKAQVDAIAAQARRVALDRADPLVDAGTTTIGRCFKLLFSDRIVLLCFLGIVAHVGVDVGINAQAPRILTEHTGDTFTEIAATKNTDLATVAPGIAEALMATGIGLVAAIPAVVFYNKLNADSERILGGYEAFADEFATILSRQLDA